jgi:Clp amino terminal domain, pathogenicity island component
MLTSIDRQHMLTVMSRPGIEPFSPEAVSVFAAALEHAHRFGHRHLGTEHLLLAVASADHPTGAILRDHGVTPERVEEEIRAGLFGGLDRDALAAIGIDLDTVRARAEESFEPDALARAGQAVPRKRRPARLAWRRLRRPGLSAWLIRRWHRRRAAAGAPIPLRAATGLWRCGQGAPVFVPFAPGTQQSLLNIRHAALDRRDARPDIEHVALALIAMTDGPVPAILSSLGVPPQALRTAILKGYRQAR